ncbi:MAG TPA: RNA polymerase sigma factor, partial [Pyrinomonadaceae bacterium]
MLKTLVRQPDHEEAFLQRYTRLRSWARRLVQNDPQQAEDLLHDVFLQFTVSHPDLSTIENLDAYLHTMLRNMHLSQLRQLARVSAGTRSLIDYESARAGLETLKREAEAQACDELRRICQYALLRKSTSKIASVLILRFFHGYYPVEIARIIRKSPGAVDQALSRARAEARAFLSDPNSLAFITSTTESSRVNAEHADIPTEDLLLELQALIFASASGDCFAEDELRAGNGEVSSQWLAHVVSCRSCLDRVNEILGLPLMSTRYPTNTLTKDKKDKRKSDGGPEGGAGTGAGPGGGDGDDFLSNHRRRVKELLDHRPQQLRVAVNGFILGTQSVTSELSNQALSVSLEERIRFIEVFSEREVRLLFCGVEPPPDGPAEYQQRVELSDGRRLELSVDFAESRPQVNVTYSDPGLLTAAQSETSDQVLKSQQPEAEPVVYDRLSARLTENPAPHVLTKVLNAFRVGSGLWLRPATVTLLVALLCLAVLVFVYRRGPTPALSVSELLHRAAIAEDASTSSKEQVVHRTLRLEERTTAGDLVASRRIEIWQGAERGVVARRLYDEHGALVAGDWRRSDGVQTIYHHGKQPQIALGNRQSAIANDNVWLLSPSAKDFALLIGDRGESGVNGGSGGAESAVRAGSGTDRVAFTGLRVQERGNAFVISAQRPAA